MAKRVVAGLKELLVSNPPPFAVLQRPEMGNRLEILLGEVTEVCSIEDLGIPPSSTGPARQELLVLVPYRQLTERGFECVDDGAPMLQMMVRSQGTVNVTEALGALPDEPVELKDARFDTDDETYAEVVRSVLRDEIGSGAGSNFVIRRSFTATLADFSPRHALSLFRRLLVAEQGTYWTFVVHTGSRTFVGASPEKHVSLDRGTVVMNPISGTYRYPPEGPSTQDVLRFLADRKEEDELHMVLDEELKMMARICDRGGTVVGPRLRQMARLAHTEYLIEGQTKLDVRDILRETLFAPTVTGSPLESACRVIKRYEPSGRGYYSGAIALIGHDAAGYQTLDSAILIRTAEIERDGRLRAGVGATLVRHSDPGSEVAETRSKLAGMLAAFEGGVDAPHQRERGLSLDANPLVREALDGRNKSLARFWLRADRGHVPTVPELVGRRVLVIDGEDTFTAMLGHQLTALGLTVSIRGYDESFEMDDDEFIVLGPGPGDPRVLDDPKIATLRRIARRLLHDRRRFLAVCLGHQVLCGLLGLEVVPEVVPNQGEQIDIDLLGERRTVAFYNTFVARSSSDRLYHRDLPGPVVISREPDSGRVYALSGPGFRSIQFHPESVLTIDGMSILGDLLGSLVPITESLPAQRGSSGVSGPARTGVRTSTG
ncbi:anthranilate synthase family protein [Saccharopolyspora hattusasensis]|uniref:anthranilate synthase family protein n=1 Tax=Saccharopolyspora hattusasensis TaxID=1128679 RepID=UPI003D99FF54